MSDDRKIRAEEIDMIKYYHEEINKLSEVEAVIETLFVETKAHLDNVKRTPNKASLKFISDQTSNLIGLKTASLSCIKETATLKKSALDFLMKSEKNNADTATNTKLIKELLSYARGEDKHHQVDEQDDEDDDDDDNVDRLIEARIKQLEASGDLEFCDNEVNIKYEKIPVKVMIVLKGDEWHFAAYDMNGKKVKNYRNLPDKSMCDIEFKKKKKGGKTKHYAIDRNDEDRIYEVKKIKSEK